jgi:hypothetical protein
MARSGEPTVGAFDHDVVDETRLADAGVPTDDDHLRLTAGDAIESVLESCTLTTTADESAGCCGGHISLVSPRRGAHGPEDIEPISAGPVGAVR